MKNKKKRFSLKEIFSDRYTPFQRMWIIILMILICVFLILTVFQIGSLALRGHSSSEKVKTASVPSASPSAGSDSVVLPQTRDAGRDYVDNTLFLGDSNTVRFMNTTDENGETYTSKENTIAVVGMGVDAIDSMKCMEFSTGTFTMVDSVKILQPQRIIITFGTNNLSGSDSESERNSFIESYTRQLKKIVEAYPTVDLIVNSIPPIAEDTIYTKLDAKEIMHWNTAIEEMCRKNKWHYLNSFEALANTETGYALDGMMDKTDGLHLGDKGLKTLFNYIRTHASVTEDDRPKPLKDIPEIIGCKTDMITTNPLTGSSFTGNEGGYNNRSGNHTYVPENRSEEQNTIQNAPQAQQSQSTPEQPQAPSQSNPVPQPEQTAQPIENNNQNGSGSAAGENPSGGSAETGNSTEGDENAGTENAIQ